MNDVIYTWQIGVPEAIVLVAAFVSHPVVRLFTRLTTVVGAVSATCLLARESKWFRYFLYVLTLVVAVVLLSGCAAKQTEFAGETVATTEVAPISGVYCAETLEEYRLQLKEKLQCIDCDMPKFSAIAEEYDNCVVGHKEDNFIVNPFNRLRGL